MVAIQDQTAVIQQLMETVQNLTNRVADLSAARGRTRTRSRSRPREDHHRRHRRHRSHRDLPVEEVPEPSVDAVAGADRSSRIGMRQFDLLEEVL